MKDMRETIVPRSDQLNADDLLISPITVKIRDVQIRDSKEQPVSIFYEGDNGKPYKPGKSMCRVMVVVWGADASKYIGQSMTLYRKETVRWGGLEVGGIRISHMTGIEDTMTIVLTETKGSKKPHVVKPLTIESAPVALRPDAQSSASGIDGGVADPMQGSAGEIAARKKALEAYEMASSRIKQSFAELDDTPISQMTMKGAMNAAKWLQAQIDLEAKS